ncbi:hypothetical protein CBS14141_003024 [Malassezia furfur]|nr:hypothetical protein CBS14141_003024 [Malassezia furfur]
MKLILKSIVLLVAIASLVLADSDEDSVARCKCFMRGTGWNLSGDSKLVCDTLKNAHYNNQTQECVIGKNNWYGPGAFNDICVKHLGFTNCQMKDRQINRRSIPDKKLERRSKNVGVQKEKANCQCLNTILAEPVDEKTKETCESIAGATFDEELESCKISPTNDLQLEEFRRYCLLFFSGSSC